MSINNMWSQNTELLFFKSCENFASPEQLFYITDENKYFAYWPKIITEKNQHYNQEIR